MTLAQRIDDDIKSAMKARDSLKLSALRMLKAAVSNAAIQKSKPALEDAEVMDVIAKLIKQREESIAAFEKGGRPEMAEKEKQEAAVLKAYLPPAMPDSELEALIRSAIRETGASGPQGMGAVMKSVQPKVAGRADGKRLSEWVRKLLGS